MTSPLQTVYDDLELRLTKKNAELLAAQTALATLEDERYDLQEAVNAIKNLIGAETLTPKPQRIGMFKVASRSAPRTRPGHFIEQFKDGSWKCSCEGFTFNGYCWASDKIRNSTTYGRAPFTIYSASAFDSAKNKVTFAK